MVTGPSYREFRIIFVYWRFNKKEGHEFTLVFVVHESLPASLSCKGSTRNRTVREYESKYMCSRFLSNFCFPIISPIIITIIITIIASQGIWSEYQIAWSKNSNVKLDCRLVPKVRVCVI